jgi:hypothetical protein
MLKISTGLAAKLMVTGSAKSLFDGGLIKVYGGTVAADADAAATGTLLWTISVGGTGTGITFESAAVGRSMVKKTSETWQGATTAGTATYYRLVASGDDGTLSTTQARVQGTVGNQADADFYMSNPTLSTNAAVDAKVLPGFMLTMPLSMAG